MDLINFPIILIHIANIIVLFLILRKVLHKPVSKYLKKREDKIAEQLDHAAQAEKDAGDLRAKYQEQLDHANEEAAGIIEKSRELAQQQYKEIIAGAKEQAQELLARAKKEIDNEKKAAQEEMRSQITEMAMQIAGKVLEREISVSDNKNIIDEFFKKVD